MSKSEDKATIRRTSFVFCQKLVVNGYVGAIDEIKILPTGFEPATATSENCLLLLLNMALKIVLLLQSNGNATVVEDEVKQIKLNLKKE